MDEFTTEEKNDMRDIFGVTQRLGKKTTKRMAVQQGFNSRRAFIRFWRGQLDIARRERDNAFSFVEIQAQIDGLRRDIFRQAFQVTFRSYTNRNIEITKQFDNMWHFNNWAVNWIRESVNTYTDSTGLSFVVTDGVWDFMMYEITEITGGAVGKDTNFLKAERKFKGDYQIFTVRQVKTQHNNCGLECINHLLKTDITYLNMRQYLNVEANESLTYSQIFSVYNKYAPKLNAYDITQQQSKLQIVNVDSDVKCNNGDHNLLFHKNHYYVIIESEERPYETEDKVKRGVIYWDIETRKTEDYCMVGKTKSFYLKDVILHAWVKPYKANDYIHISFTTNSKDSSCRQFLNWLKQQGRESKYYYLYAHNGGNFDVYFIIMNFTAEEANDYIPSLRGSTVIKLEYGNNMFLDTYCFLTDKLSKLSSSFKIETAKLQEFTLPNGDKLTNEQMCFYKPDLSFDEFLELETKEPEFWKLYNDYCLVDCIALQQIWDKFSASIGQLIDIFVEKAPHRKRDLLSKCCLRQSCTIGGHAQKILNNLSGVDKLKKSKASFAFKNFSRFIDTREKHDYLMNNFKRGGISHCNKKGKHVEGVMSVDICSQYPASMVHMKIPSGNSEMVNEYYEDKHGYYILTDLVFDSNLNFKPVCGILKKKSSKVLNWSTGNTIERLAIDSYMIKYLKQHYGLVSFNVESGLVSNYEIEGKELFGNYVEALFTEKAKQDVYKNSKDPKIHALYNSSYRETIKLYLNAITGKLVMDREKYNSLTLRNDDKDEDEQKKTKVINGTVFVEQEKENLNEWINAGVMVYSYSKRLLFEYIRNMPNNSDDVIHVETDSIYFPISCEEKFNENIKNYKGEYPVAYGNDLGNIKVEKRDTDVCYFLNKKAYTIGGNYIWKGIPKDSITEDGTRYIILDKEKYERVYNHKKEDEPITIQYSTMNRVLFGNTKISGHIQTRTMNSTYDYQQYI